MTILTDLLREKNQALYVYGLVCFALTIVCMALMRFTSVKVMGVNAWLKPLKFCLSIGIMSWTMGYFMQYLDSTSKVNIYNIVFIAGMSFELAVILIQAARGRQSHFNVATRLDGALFTAMGVVITIVTLWTLYIGILFFCQQQFSVPITLIWGIRLGIVISVVFSFQGAIMGSRLRHNVGGEDDEPGIAIVNWSRQHGDLRIAHFFGIHSLQVIPLLSIFAHSPAQVIVIASIWTAFVAILLKRALAGKPLFKANAKKL